MHDEEKNIFIITNLSNMKANFSLRLFDVSVHMEVQGLTVLDNLTKIKDFQTILTTEKKSENINEKIIDINILMYK